MNFNPETGIPFGVVSLNSLAEWVYDEFVYNGTNLTLEAAIAESIAEGMADENGELSDEWFDRYEAEEESYSLDTDGMKLELSYLGGAPLVFVLESPHTTRARLCSPCIPGAGDLDSPDPEGMEAYTLPPEWFADKA